MAKTREDSYGAIITEPRRISPVRGNHNSLDAYLGFGGNGKRDAGHWLQSAAQICFNETVHPANQALALEALFSQRAEARHSAATHRQHHKQKREKDLSRVALGCGAIERGQSTGPRVDRREWQS